MAVAESNGYSRIDEAFNPRPPASPHVTRLPPPAPPQPQGRLCFRWVHAYSCWAQLSSGRRGPLTTPRIAQAPPPSRCQDTNKDDDDAVTEARPSRRGPPIALAPRYNRRHRCRRRRRGPARGSLPPAACSRPGTTACLLDRRCPRAVGRACLQGGRTFRV